jgi:hypothetical protein
MIGTMRTAKRRAALLIAGAGVLLVAAAPVPVSHATLGSEWRCSKMALVFTTCRQASNHHLTGRTGDAKSPPA